MPKCLEGEKLPEKYYAPVNPYKPPAWNVNLKSLAEYAETKGVNIAELTREEYDRFKII